MRLLITGPARSDPGGVSAFYDAVLPELSGVAESVEYLEVGGTLRRGGVLSPLVDQLRFGRALHRLRPDLYLCNPSLDPRSFLRDGLFIARAARQGTRVVVFFHGWREGFADSVERRFLPFFRRTYGRATAFIVLASKFRERLRKWGVDAPIELGVTAVSAGLLVHGNSPPPQPPANAGNGVVRLLFLARLERTKGIRETLEAFRLLHEGGARVTLTVAGDGAARSDVQEYLKANPAIARSVTLAGDVRGARKREVLSSHDVYCFPSYTEGMPASVLEAMSFGMPVVTAPVGGLADFFEDGRMGSLVPRPDGASLAVALQALVLDPEKRRDMGAYNRRYALEHFSAGAAARRLAGVLAQSLCAACPR